LYFADWLLKIFVTAAIENNGGAKGWMDSQCFLP
jgi:hypothetical protein